MKSIIIIVALILGVMAENIEFIYTLEDKSPECFISNPIAGQQITVDVKDLEANRMLKLTVNNPKGRQITGDTKEGKISSTFAVSDNGAHSICVQNMGARENIRIKMKIVSNIDDMRQEEITKNHLIPVEASAYKLKAMIDDLRKELSDLVAAEVEISDKNESIKSRVRVFGVVSLIVMGVSTYLQIKYLKSFFRKKKII